MHHINVVLIGIAYNLCYAFNVFAVFNSLMIAAYHMHILITFSNYVQLTYYFILANCSWCVILIEDVLWKQNEIRRNYILSLFLN